MPVYVIQAGDGGPCKIGHGRDVRQRLSELQTATHVRLRLIAAYEGGAAAEAALHRHFADFRLSGEWFDLTPEAALRDIKLKPFDASKRVAAAPKSRPYLIALMDDRGIEPVGSRRIGPGRHAFELTRLSNAFAKKVGEAEIGVELLSQPEPPFPYLGLTLLARCYTRRPAE